MEETKTSNITLGTLYDMNKSIIKNQNVLTREQSENKKEDIINFINKKKDNYFMLLCNERRDYTLFNIKNDSIEAANILVDECLKNRGLIKGIDITKYQGAIEIWLQIEDEVYCYYFFPYNDGVVEV